MGCITSKPHTKTPRYAALSPHSARATMSFAPVCACRPAPAPSAQSVQEPTTVKGDSESKREFECSDSAGEELKQEIRSRQSSAVHTHVTRFEQLNVSANFTPVLRDIRHIKPGGKTVANVSLFERLEKDAKEKPVLHAGSQEVSLGNSRIIDRVMSFEGMEQTRRENATRSLDAMKKSRERQAERQRLVNKMPAAVSTYSM